MAVLISVTEDDVTQIVLADVGVQGATGPSSPASGTPFTPYGNIAATNVQTAIQELDDEKFGKAGGTVTGNLEIGTGGTLSFEGATADGFETTLAVVDPTADRTLTLPNITGTFVTTGDTGTVTSAMLLDGTILNADVSASAAIVDTKLATIATAGKVSNSATTAASANTASAIVVRDASGNFAAGTITAALTGAASSNALKTGDTMTGPLVIPAGTVTAAGLQVGTGTTDKPGIYSPGADQLAIATLGTGRVFVTSTGLVGIGATAPTSLIHGKGTFAAHVTYRLEPISDLYKSTLYVSSVESGDGGIQYDSNSNHLRMFSYDTLSFNVGTANISGAIGNERARIDSSGRLLVGTSSHSGDEKLVVNGSSKVGDVVTRSLNFAAVGASTGTADITMPANYAGFLVVQNRRADDAFPATYKTYSVFAQGTNTSFQQVHGYDHPSGAAAFTVTSPSSGTIRITNQYVLSSDIEVFLQYRAMGTI